MTLDFHDLLLQSDIYKYIRADTDPDAARMLLDFAEDVSNMTLLEVTSFLPEDVSNMTLPEVTSFLPEEE
jgi:hypothetical protein